jgi:signal transduction histidine kinase
MEEKPMTMSAINGAPTTEINLLVPYVSDLEVEVDRLRGQAAFVEQSVRDAVRAVRALCNDEHPTKPAVPAIKAIVDELALVLRDVRERPGYHPGKDQVVAVAVRPLAEQVFRWQQRVHGAPDAVLRQTIEAEHVEWFPARFRHILDGLISNALRYRDRNKGECRVGLDIRRVGPAYEIRVSDNGRGIAAAEGPDVLDLLARASPARAAGLGVGLAVVKLLVEQSGGSLTVESSNGHGTCFVAILPRFDVDDFIDQQ